MGKAGKQILVVDDDRAVRDSLKFALELEGLSVQTHAGGSALLDDRSLSSADCLVLDCRMPDMDGFAVLSEMARRHIHMPVILMTAPVNEKLRSRARKAGAFTVLEKPLLGDVLVRNVRAAITA